MVELPMPRSAKSDVVGDRNRSLERGIAILRAFRPGVSELGNSEISERTGLAKATVSRLTQTLVAVGFLERNASRRVYRLAPAVLSLAHAMRLGSPILPTLAPLMRNEATRRRVNVGLAAADGDMMVYLESFRYSPRSSFRTVVSGQRVPVELTSLGRAYLWALPHDQRERELADIADRRARVWPQLRREIEASFEELDRLGYCSVRWQPGVFAVAAPIIAVDLSPHAINISVSSADTQPSFQAQLGPWLIDLRVRCLAELEDALATELG
ncbi:IclR family transcriptional regulator [Bosea thiooxidans]